MHTVTPEEARRIATRHPMPVVSCEVTQGEALRIIASFPQYIPRHASDRTVRG
jgi:hypothetical protein